MIIIKDILDIDTDIIVHQVNCVGSMGKGLALSIRKQYPIVYEKYKAHTWVLGRIQPVQVSDRLWVINLCGQAGCNENQRMTSYDALKVAWPKIQEWANGKRVHAPWMFGCGLGGGDWSIVRPLVESACPDVIWCKLPLTE